MTESSECHPDSYMSDGVLLHKLLKPQGNLTYEEIATQEMTPDERKLINEFIYLLEKSKQLFAQLRNLPQHGQFNWQIHFSRTFDTFSKLWKFQQDNRTVLDSKYGLQRWQIGEIASRIGQLYYHYYLRTSDTNYLQEALIFYLAIRQRNYYGEVNDEDIILVKKLRYYARFLVVSLMVNKMDLVMELKDELATLIEEYSESHSQQDVKEWRGVLHEVTNFRQALSHIAVFRVDTSPVVLPHRLVAEHLVLPELALSPNPLKLAHAVIVGAKIGQPKVTELSIDMYRMTTLIERSPKFHSSSTITNPLKQFLYKPSTSELLCSLASVGRDLPAQCVQLLYLSGNSISYTDRTAPNEAYTCEGGLYFKHTQNKKPGGRYDRDLLHAEDLNPFFRYPTVLIVEGEEYNYFSSLSPVFRQPVVALLSAPQVPHTIKGENMGSLMTMFLHCPMSGMAVLCNLSHLREHQWKQCTRLLNSALCDILTAISSSKNVHSHFIQLLDDPFIRIIIVRFCFCVTVLHMHSAFKTDDYYPTSVPTLPLGEVIDRPSVKRAVVDIANTLESLVLFSES